MRKGGIDDGAFFFFFCVCIFFIFLVVGFGGMEWEVVAVLLQESYVCVVHGEHCGGLLHVTCHSGASLPSLVFATPGHHHQQ